MFYHSVMRQVVARHIDSEAKTVSEPVFLILTSLLDQPRHGYALLQQVQRISDGRVRLSTGTLYAALRRLLEDGLIDRFEQEDTSRDKQAYSLTAAGRRLLAAEVSRMKRLAAIAQVRLKRTEAMMQALFESVIRFYPEEYRTVFGDEMLSVLAQREAEIRQERPLRSLRFWVTELGALIRGAFTEQMAKHSDPRGYGWFSSRVQETGDLAQDRAGLEVYRKEMIRLMERAIAHHDFPRARLYSDEERRAAAMLCQSV